jgi:hypothetical protein
MLHGVQNRCKSCLAYLALRGLFYLDGKFADEIDICLFALPRGDPLQSVQDHLRSDPAREATPARFRLHCLDITDAHGDNVDISIKEGEAIPAHEGLYLLTRELVRQFEPLGRLGLILLFAPIVYYLTLP